MLNLRAGVLRLCGGCLDVHLVAVVDVCAEVESSPMLDCVRFGDSLRLRVRWRRGGAAVW